MPPRTAISCPIVGVRLLRGGFNPLHAQRNESLTAMETPLNSKPVGDMV